MMEVFIGTWGFGLLVAMATIRKGETPREPRRIADPKAWELNVRTNWSRDELR